MDEEIQTAVTESPDSHGAETLVPPQRTSGESAPYGHRLDGTPRKSRAGRPPRTSTSSTPKKTPSRRKSPGTRRAAAAGPDYRPGIIAGLQLPAGALAMLGMKDPAFALDGLTLALHTPNIAEALNDLARENPAVAAALEYVMRAGPYGAIIAAVVPLVAQLLANHGAIPAGIMGTMTADELQAMAVQLHGAPA